MRLIGRRGRKTEEDHTFAVVIAITSVMAKLSSFPSRSKVVMAVRFFAPTGPFGALSNFFVLPSPLMWNNKPFMTSEHLYHYLKYWYDGASAESREYAELVRESSTPFKAKLLANQVAPTRFPWQRELLPVIERYCELGVRPRADWDEVKRDNMLLCLRLKFGSSAICRDVLLGTGDKLLIEASPYDGYWGIGRTGTGLNVLGKLLAQVRSEMNELASVLTLDAAVWSLEFEDANDQRRSTRPTIGARGETIGEGDT